MQQRPAAPHQPDPASPPPEAAMRFRTLLYRFLFFDWLFTDLSLKMTALERHAAWTHNRAMSRYLPLYLRRWAVLAALDFSLGCMFESLLASALMSAWFFVWCCVIVSGMLLTAVLWAFLNAPELR